MAQKNFRTNISLNKKQLLDAKLQVLAGSYASAEEGMFWWNSTGGVKRPEVHNGSTVKQLAYLDEIGTGGGGDAATLDGQEGTWYQDRTNHTGTQAAATISDFVSAVLAAIPAEYETATEVQARIDAILDGAPAALDTLNEIAAAVNDDANFAASVNTAIGERAKHFSVNIGDGTALSYTITHNLNTRATVVSLMDNTTFEEFDAQVAKPTVNTHVISFDAPAPPLNSVLVTVAGK